MAAPEEAPLERSLGEARLWGTPPSASDLCARDLKPAESQNPSSLPLSMRDLIGRESDLKAEAVGCQVRY